MSLEEYSALILADYFTPAYRGGGPIQTLEALTAAAPSNFNLSLICLNADLGDASPLVGSPDKWVLREKVRVWYSTPGVFKVLKSFRLARFQQKYDVLYLNSFFSPLFSIVPQILALFHFWGRTEVLIAPRGQFHKGALELKSAKKRVFISIYRVFRFDRNVTWHASTELEAREIRGIFGESSSVLIRENETSLPSAALSRPPREDSVCRLIFASRLSPKKGLHIALQALKYLDAECVFNIIGDFEDKSYEIECMRLASQVPSGITVVFTGALPRADVLVKLSEADCFIFPTAGENFGHIIAESLSVSCPVYTSDSTPWSPSIHSGAGVVIRDSNVQLWAAAIQEFIAGGPVRWSLDSLEAGHQYNLWRSAEKGTHVFSQLIDAK